MRKHLRESGLPCAKTFENHNEVVFPVIVKPSEFMSSIGVSLVREQSELSRRIEEARTIDIPEESLRLHYQLSEQVVVEEYIEGEEFSIECWVDKGKVLSWQVTKKIKIDPPCFFESGHISSAPVTGAFADELPRFVEKIVKNFEFQTGLYHIEVINRKGVPYTVEIAARPGGDMIQLLYMLTSSLDYPKIMGDLMAGKDPGNINWEFRGYGAVFFPFGRNIRRNELEKIISSHSCEAFVLSYNDEKKSEDLSERFGQVIMRGSYQNLLDLIEQLNRMCAHVV
jgi:biotin carboxylase